MNKLAVVMVMLVMVIVVTVMLGEKCSGGQLFTADSSPTLSLSLTYLHCNYSSVILYCCIIIHWLIWLLQ